MGHSGSGSSKCKGPEAGAADRLSGLSKVQKRGGEGRELVQGLVGSGDDFGCFSK